MPAASTTRSSHRRCRKSGSDPFRRGRNKAGKAQLRAGNDGTDHALYRKIEPPAWQMSLGLLQLNGDEVLGSDKDIKKIEAKLWAEGKLVLHGFSGIGKTKLVTLLGTNGRGTIPVRRCTMPFTRAA